MVRASLNLHLLFLFLLFPLISVHAALRIVSLKPNITDVLMRIEAGGNLVGATTFCTLPPALAAVPRVSDYVRANLEAVVAAAPTLIITSKENSEQKEINRLRELGFRVELVSFQSLDGIYAAILQIGNWVGKTPEAQALVGNLKTRLAALAARAAALPSQPRLLWMVGQRPMVAVGGKTIFGDFFAALHLDNPLASSVLPYPQLSKEQLFALDPDWIFDISEAESNPRLVRLYADHFTALRAVREHHVHVLSAADFLPGPPLWDGLEQVIGILEAGWKKL